MAWIYYWIAAVAISLGAGSEEPPAGLLVFGLFALFAAMLCVPL